MKTVAPTKTTVNSTAQRFARSRSAVETAPVFNPAAASALPLQRKAACPCGGGCPGCQANSNDLKVSQPNDPAEIEANNIADRVMRMPAQETVPVSSSSHSAGIIQRKCDSCKDDEETIQRKPLPSAGGITAQSPAHVKNAISSGGRPLDPGTRNFFESRFDRDFSNVRVHTGASAEQSSRDVNAKAYTIGHSVVFGARQFAPETHEGRRLLAHELTHVIQQNGGGKSLQNETVSERNGRTDDPVPEWSIDSDSIASNITSVNAGVIHRVCGSAEIGEPIGCITSTGVVSGLKYLFQVNCDDFAVGNEADLRMDAEQIQAGDTVDIHGLASSEGDAVFNMHLSCARALRARAVIESVLSVRGITATIQVFNHGATSGDVTQQRSVVVSNSRSTPVPVLPPQTANRCGPDATDWFINQVNTAKSDPTVLAIQARLAGAERVARAGGFSAERIAEGGVAKKVLAEESRLGSPARTTEASSQIAASVAGQREFGRALLAASVPIFGMREALVLAAIKGAATAWKGLVGTGMRYDFKNDSRTMQNPTSANCPADCANTITLCPSTSSDCYIVDVPGNLFYAHVGKFIGWTELSLQLGSQFAQLDSSATWDPPEDTRMISFAFALPDPLTRSDLCTAINSSRSVFDLQNCSNCSEPTTAQLV